MNAAEIEIAVANLFGIRRSLIVPNVSWGLTGLYYEADIVVITKSGYAKEIEIKVSKADLLKDQKKKHKHDCKHFRELYFAIPGKLLKHKDLIPERAGIICCKIEDRKYYDGSTNRFYWARIERHAQVQKGVDPLDISLKYELARLGTMRIFGLKGKILELKNGGSCNEKSNLE
jgi:hypothetical protein